MPIAYRCRDCKYTHVRKWGGRCPGCYGFFNIQQVNEDLPGAEAAEPVEGEVVSLQDAIDHVVETPRIETNIEGVDFVLSGGFAENGVYLLTGEPGSGKTTLLLQILRQIAIGRRDVLFLTGEQTVGDLGKLGKRIGKFPAKLGAVRMSDLDEMLDTIEERQPAVVVIDSAQTVYVDDELEIGGVSSIKAAIRALTECAKDNHLVVIIIGHLTKGGSISGPRALEALVDCTIHLRKQGANRYLQVHKNRFGVADRTVRFLMGEETPGLEDCYRKDLEAEEKARQEEIEALERAEQKAKDALDAARAVPASVPKAPPATKKRLKSVPLEPGQADLKGPSKKSKAPLSVVKTKSTEQTSTISAPSSPTKPSKVSGTKAPKTSGTNAANVPNTVPPKASGTDVNTWVAPDGTTSKAVLAIACAVEGCRGKIDRACTSSSGVREAGFHQSRVTRAREAAKAKESLTQKNLKPAVKEPEPIGKDPFEKKFGAPPKVKPKQKPKSKTKPKDPDGARP